MGCIWKDKYLANNIFDLLKQVVNNHSSINIFDLLFSGIVLLINTWIFNSEVIIMKWLKFRFPYFIDDTLFWNDFTCWQVVLVQDLVVLFTLKFEDNFILKYALYVYKYMFILQSLVDILLLVTKL